MRSVALVIMFTASPAFAFCLDVHERLQTTFGACPADFPSPIGLCSKGTLKGFFERGTTRFRANMASFGAGGVDANTTISYGGDFEVTDRWGSFTSSDVGLEDTAGAVFTEISRIKSGTGRYKNAKGTLFISGHASADGLTFTGEVTGQICF